jgi:hypothetical protein
MNEKLLARTTFVLLRETADDLAFLSQSFGVSRSELVRGLLTEPVERMAELVRGVPAEPSPADLRQLAIDGLDMIDELGGGALAQLREVAQRDD